MSGPGRAKPEAHSLCKWVGGKRGLLPALLKRVPQNFNTYFEPFVGGGALFFALQPARAVLTDANPLLVRTYCAVRDDVESVIAQAEQLAALNSREFYYAMRAVDPAGLPDAAAAAWFLYVNRAGFNGLWRVNKAGRLNVPYGSKVGAFAIDADNLRACSRALQGAGVGCCSFEYLLDLARPGDFVYCDPPYVPVTASASFTAYTADGFGDTQQVRLRDVALALKARGVHVLLSNSSAPRVRELYAEFQQHEIFRSGRISSKGAGRQPVAELLIW